jgi:hypothetical protein
MGASLLGVDLRSADLSRAVFDANSFQVTLDQSTKFEGASGSVFGLFIPRRRPPRSPAPRSPA